MFYSSTSALALQADELIQDMRGHIESVSREGLEEYACECCEPSKTEFDLWNGKMRGDGTLDEQEDL